MWVAATVRVEGADPVWPQFRGPQGAGIAEAEKPPIEFGVERNVLWKRTVPSGFSSPIAVGDQLIMTGFEDGKLYTLSYNRADGQERWRAHAPAQAIERFHQTEGSPAASTPATDGERIVSYFGSCGLFCYDLAGKLLWKYELPTAQTMLDFGTGTSPIIVDGVVVLVRDQRTDSRIYAFDVASGDLLWERARESQASHSTPAVWKTAAGTQIVAPGVGRMIGYDLKTGNEQWWVKGMPAMCCASPVVADGLLLLAAWSPGEDAKLPSFDDLITAAGEKEQGYVTREGADRTALKGFFDNQDFNHDGRMTREEWETAVAFTSKTEVGAMVVKPGGQGDITDTHVAWRKKKNLPYVPTVIHYGNQCVTVKDGGIVVAYDLPTGDVLFTRRLPASGRYYASPVAANGHIFLTALDEGVVSVVKAGQKDLDVVASNPLGERIAATPAIASDTLYLRTLTQLYAFRK